MSVRRLTATDYVLLLLEMSSTFVLIEVRLLRTIIHRHIIFIGYVDVIIR